MKSINIKLESLEKMYPANLTPTLKKINLEVYSGEVFGLIGKNGSGKSTTIKCITGVIPYNDGNIFIKDINISNDSVKAKQYIGYNADNHPTYEEMTGKEYVYFISSVYNKVIDDKKFDLLCHKFDIINSIDNVIKSYSHGMKQKIALIATLMHEPEIWILDEPFVGLDVMASFYLIEKIKEYKKMGKTVFLTSHNIDTVARICDRVAIINDGEIVKIIDEINVNDLEKEFFNLIKKDQEDVL